MRDGARKKKVVARAIIIEVVEWERGGRDVGDGARQRAPVVASAEVVARGARVVVVALPARHHSPKLNDSFAEL